MFCNKIKPTKAVVIKNAKRKRCDFNFVLKDKLVLANEMGSFFVEKIDAIHPNRTD